MENRCKIVIVDDEVLARQGLKHLVNWEQEGFEIAGEASHGGEALELIERLRPHIVITDIVMPVMDGLELARAVKNRFPEIKMIVLSSFGEFDYVRSSFQSGAVDYILKPKLEAEDLLAILKQTARSIPSLHWREPAGEYQWTAGQLLEKLISGYGDDIDPTDAAKVFPYGGFCWFGADVSRLSRKEDHVDGIFSKIKSELESRIQPVLFERIPESGDRLALLVNAEVSALPRLKQAAQALADWSEERQLDLTWMVGEGFNDLRQAGEEYRNRFIPMADYRFYLSDQRLLIWSELPSVPEAEMTFDMKRFTEEMNRMHFDESFQYVRDYAAKRAKQYRTDVFEFKSFLGNVIFNVTTLLSNLGFDLKDLEEEKYTYFKKIEDTKTAEEALEWLDTFLSQVRERIASRRTPANLNMKKLLDYIHEHYMEPISLKDVADHFHFNPSYLSSFFAAHNKESFSEYVNKIRVEKAAELLRTDEAPIAEIGSRVGYSDHSYFTKVFKKLTGLSPSQYRKLYGMKDREPK